MRSTGISCFAYPGLVKALGLAPRRPKIYDTAQMLAVPDSDVLDALNCDVAFVETDVCTNAFEEPERWKPYDFGGRLSALVQQPELFRTSPQGEIEQGTSLRMPLHSYVFDAEHGGEPLDLNGELRREDPEKLRRELEREVFTRERVRSIGRYCARARSSTDRALLFSGLSMGFFFRGGMANWSMLCLTDPAYVREVHEVLTEHALRQVRALVPEIAHSVDILMLNMDDLGTQTGLIMPPRLFGELYVPYYRAVNDKIHRIAPRMKTFLHCCGAIYDILEEIIASGFDILNPVQWSAGRRSYREWKDRCRGRIALWGGGVDTQHILPWKSPEQLRGVVREVVAYLKQDSGYVFCAIHNLLAEITPEKILAIYQEAASA